MAEKVLIPGMHEALQQHGIKYEYHGSYRRFKLFFGRKHTIIHILSATNIRDALGLNLAFFGIDEADTMNTEVALESWRKLSGALRAGNPAYQQKVAVSTPEGFGFMHQHWVDSLNDDNRSMRRLIRGKTLDNPFLPPNYLDDLRATYPAHYLNAYLNGEFVNMAGRAVYDHYSFEDGANLTNLTLGDLDPTERLLIGVDFNVEGMSAVIAVQRGQEVHVVDELLGAFNTQALIDQIKEEYTGKQLLVFPDPAGNQRKSSTTNTDHGLIRQAAMPMRLMSSHPRVRDRVNSVNAMFKNGNGDRRLLVNKQTCPGLHKSLMTQVWDSNDKPKKNVPIGLPSTKNTYIDGPLDALGYMIYTNWPVRGFGASNIKLVGV